MAARPQKSGSAVLCRLKTRAQFQAVLSGATVAKTSHFAMHCCDVGAPANSEVSALFISSTLWLGAMVPKRWAKRAVTRNTIKRQIYQLGFEFAGALPHMAHLVRLRREFDRQQFVSATSDALKTKVRSELLELFDRVVKLQPPLALNTESSLDASIASVSLNKLGAP